LIGVCTVGLGYGFISYLGNIIVHTKTNPSVEVTHHHNVAFFLEDPNDFTQSEEVVLYTNVVTTMLVVGAIIMWDIAHTNVCTINANPGHA
jgi:hypothetical protein